MVFKKTVQAFISSITLFSVSSVQAGYWNDCQTKTEGSSQKTKVGFRLKTPKGKRVGKKIRETSQPELNLLKLEYSWETPNSPGEFQVFSALELIQSTEIEKIRFVKEELTQDLASIPRLFWSDRAAHYIFMENPEIYFARWVDRFVDKYQGHADSSVIVNQFSKQIARLRGGQFRSLKPSF